MRGASVGHAPHLHAATAPIACCARLCEAMRAAPTRVYTTNTASDAQIWTFCRPPMKHTGKSRMTSKSQHTTTTTIIIIIRCWHFWHAKLRSTSIGIGIYIRSRFVAWHDDDGTWKKKIINKKNLFDSIRWLVRECWDRKDSVCCFAILSMSTRLANIIIIQETTRVDAVCVSCAQLKAVFGSVLFVCVFFFFWWANEWNKFCNSKSDLMPNEPMVEEEKVNLTVICVSWWPSKAIYKYWLRSVVLCWCWLWLDFVYEYEYREIETKSYVIYFVN